MFRYLKAYDNQVIVRNLLSLLFIVIFPFVANGLTHSKPGFMFPVILYLANLMCIFISNFLLAHYIFKTNPTLTIPGHEPDKNYIYMQNKIMALMLILSFLIVLVTAMITNFDNNAIALSFYAVPFLAFIAKRWIKKYKPKKITVVT